MSNKIPCGGFYLSDTLGVDENGKLGVNGGEPYKSLVTDGSGKTKWEDRLAYGDSRVVIEVAEKGLTLVRISDEIPSWASINVPMKLWLRRTSHLMLNPEDYMDFGNGSFGASFVFFIANDNSFVSSGGDSLTFPKKGVYIMNPIPLSGLKKDYVVGISTVESDIPEITWDGNIETIKTIDPKYIPSELNEIVLPSSTSGSSKKFKITVDDSGTISATEV